MGGAVQDTGTAGTDDACDSSFWMIVDHELSLSIAERISVGPQQD